PSYTPLAQRAGILWDSLGEELGTPLLHRIGLLSMGSEASPLIQGIRKSAAIHGLSISDLRADEVRRLYPALCPPDDFVGLLEKKAGWSDVEHSIVEIFKRARSLGADLRVETEVQEWHACPDHVRVRTESGEFAARQLVITAGAWASQLLRDLHLPLVIRR